MKSIEDIRFNFIKVRQEEHVFRLTLARPEKRNAFTPTMISEMAEALRQANENPEVWVVVLDAEGPVFCAGMDLHVFNHPEEDLPNPEVPVSEIPPGEMMASLNKPSIAIVGGPVIAGGFLLAGECTFVIAHSRATFSLPEVRRGLFPMQVMATLLKVMPEKKVLEMCLTGRTYSAVEMKEAGLVTEVTDLPVQKAEGLIAELTAGSPFAIRHGMAALRVIRNMSDDLRHNYLKSVLETIKSSEDAETGYQAFVKKVTPEWTNR